MSGELLSWQHIGADGPVMNHPVIDVMVARRNANSWRGEHDDDHIVAVAIEGGGTAGMVDAGMCAVMEAADLVETIDIMYGTSSGSLNGMYTAAGKAVLGMTNYFDIANKNFATPKHLLHRKPIINFGFLFDHVIGQEKPVSLDEVEAGPVFVAVGTNVDTGEVELMTDFDNTEDMLQAVRASCAMPLLSGFPVEYRGTRITDGAMRAGVPFRQALENGASHVLALRTRGEDYRKPPYKAHEIYLPVLAGGVRLAQLIKERPALYNSDAEELQHNDSAAVVQIAPGGSEPEPVVQMEKSHGRLREGFRLGVEAAGRAFGMPELDVDWQQWPPAVILKSN